MEAQSRKTAVAWLSVISNTTLVIGKLIIGLLIGSVSIISEAIHSGVDLLAAIIALYAVRTAGKPADDDHPFGHGKVENISGTVEALLIFLAAAWIIYEAIHKLLAPERIGHLGWGMGVMLISALANMLVSSRLFKIARETDSVALSADAWHLRTDVYTSAGVMIGLAAMWLGQLLFPKADLTWLDPVAAIAVAVLILKAAFDLTRQSARDLLDASLPAEEERWICDYIGRLHPTVRGFHNLRTRKSGSMRFVEFHLIVESDMSVEDSHRISEVITCDIEDHFPGSSVLVHVEPCDGLCPDNCLAGCLLSEAERAQTVRGGGGA